MEEYIITQSKHDPDVVLYRDMDDLGRVFVTKDTLKRFQIDIPTFRIILDKATILYEISTRDAMSIINHANNSYAPYNIIYKNFDFDNEIKDNAKNNNDNATDEIIIYRDIENQDIAYVKEEVLKRFRLPKSKSLSIGDIEVYAIKPAQVINIISNANNRYAPYNIKYLNISIDHEEKEEEIENNSFDEYIGPRKREENESNDRYGAYLEGFFDGIDYHRKRTIKNNIDLLAQKDN